MILAIVWQLCRYHYLQLLGSKTEKDILEWANEKAGSVCHVSSFNDKGLRNGRFLIKLCESVADDPECIDWDIVTQGETDEDAE